MITTPLVYLYYTICSIPDKLFVWRIISVRHKDWNWGGGGFFFTAVKLLLISIFKQVINIFQLFSCSVDQFFECFDELRTSQSALGNSGMWNWTCSVFSAITAASNLESGSLHIPTGTSFFMHSYCI